MSLTDEEYWKKSTLEGFNFDDDADEPPTSLSPSEGSTEPVFSSTLRNNAALPTHAIISKWGLDIILQDTRLPPEIRTYSTEETIKKLFLGLPCLLDNFRSLEQKIDLLQKAVETADGNIILKVVLFLEKTLKQSLLHIHLPKYKLALVHYCNYLVQENKLQELNYLYMAIGNNTGMSNLFYIPCQNFSSRKRIQAELEKFLNESGNVIPDCNKHLLHGFKTFIELQKTDTASKSVTELLATFYRAHFVTTYSQHDITTFCNTMKLSSSQHEWILLNVMAANQLWDNLTDAFVKPVSFSYHQG
ncbi:putative peptidyl-lysine hydroxylation [Trypoxylus dichotomus]